MRMTAYGAAGEVTGSCHLLEAGGKRILIDCGQFQGNEHAYARSAEPFPFDPRSIDAVVLTHSHLDHIGRLPLLVKAGFDGPIYATAETREIGRLILMDAAHVMYEEYGCAEAKGGAPGRGGGAAAVSPSRTCWSRSTSSSRPSPTTRRHSLGDGLSLTLRNAGHVLGSAFVEFEERRNGSGKRLTFSGDLGYRGREVMPDPDDLPSLRRRRQRGHLRRPAAPAGRGVAAGVRRRDQGCPRARRERRHPLVRAGAHAGRALLPAPDVGRRRGAGQLPHLPRQSPGDKHHRGLRAPPARPQPAPDRQPGQGRRPVRVPGSRVHAQRRGLDAPSTAGPPAASS